MVAEVLLTCASHAALHFLDVQVDKRFRSPESGNSKEYKAKSVGRREKCILYRFGFLIFNEYS